MKIQFLGTGAADWDWSKPLTDEVRGCTMTLLDGHILIDAGATALENLQRSDINPAEVTDLLITHSHSDHFKPEQISAIANADGRTQKLKVYCSKEASERLDDNMEKVALEYLMEFSIDGLNIRVLPANHSVADPFEKTFNYVIDTAENKRLFYSLDSGGMASLTRVKLADKKIDMIIWDATSGTSVHNWRFADHNDLDMIHNMRVGMTTLGYIDEKTVHVFDHIARTLWSIYPDERRAAAAGYNGILAEDGMVLEL